MRNANGKSVVLGSTTLRVYRYLYKIDRPIGIHDVQRGLGLSSPSVAQYHLRRLLQVNLIQEKDGGYVIERSIFDNLIRFRRTLIPTQLAYLSFFLFTLLIMIFMFRPQVIDGSYIFALATNFAAILIFLNQSLKVLRKNEV